MSKYLFAIIIFFLPAFVFAEVPAVDNGYTEKIDSYSINAVVKDNASIDVTEEITYDFGNNEKHGIFRYIPTVYTGRKGSPRQSISVISVTDKDGKSVPRELSNEINNEVIKIGDSNSLVTGVRIYKIRYTLTKVISTDSDGDRLRWDAIGTGWTVPIENVVITLKLTSKQIDKLQTLNCYVGTVGSTDKCEYTKTVDTARVALATLKPGTGVTLDSFFAKATFPAPSKLEIWLWETHWYYWLPLIAFFGFFMFWYERGRDPRGRGTIVPMYDAPKGITPYEASIVMDEMISKKSLPAAIISLATRGYIKIHRREVKVLFSKKTEYELELNKTLPVDASIVDKDVVSALFGTETSVNLSKLDSDFATENMKVHNAAYKEVTTKGYFVINPNISRIMYFALSIALFVGGVIASIYFLAGLVGVICFMLPGLISIVFAFIMPVRTKEGVLMKETLLGLKMYIKTAEIDRIKFHNAPAKSPEKFEELLPYAIIFGLEKEWADEFKDVYKTAPDWYDGNFTTFSVIVLASDLNSFSDSTISAAVSASADSGGFGGVGGGAGGGGGGSW